MSINPVSSGNSQLYTQASRSFQEASANKVGAKDDKESDKQNQKENKAIATPSINTNGQTTGLLINTSA